MDMNNRVGIAWSGIAGWSGTKGENWDNCNGIIIKIAFKKEKYDVWENW